MFKIGQKNEKQIKLLYNDKNLDFGQKYINNQKNITKIKIFLIFIIL